MSIPPKLIVILGPTASGKTDLSLKLARRFNGEIVSADSRQIYRGMNIGTGKIEADKRGLQRGFTRIVAKGVPHYMIDIVDPDQEFTLADYKKMALAAIRDILKRGKVPFLVGGTGLYIQAVVDNLVIPKVPPNKKLRAQFEKELRIANLRYHKHCDRNIYGVNVKKKVVERWFKKLLKLDPEAIHVVDSKNPRRIIRAIEVCLATHQPFSKLREKGEPLFDVLQIGINVARSVLYKRIDQRVDKMIKEGLIEETKRLLEKYDPSLPSMSGIGYKEIGDYLRGEISIREAVEQIKYRTHAYARRQLTWFRRDQRIKWVKSYKEAEKIITEWIRN